MKRSSSICRRPGQCVRRGKRPACLRWNRRSTSSRRSSGSIRSSSGSSTTPRSTSVTTCRFEPPSRRVPATGRGTLQLEEPPQGAAPDARRRRIDRLGRRDRDVRWSSHPRERTRNRRIRWARDRRGRDPRSGDRDVHDHDTGRGRCARDPDRANRVTPAVQQACEELRRRAIELAGEPVDYARAARLSGGTLSIMSDVAPGDEQRRYAFQSFGAQFIEVRVDEALGRVRVTRALGVFDCGRILNPKTARSQMLGGIVFGIGQALLEEGIVDKRTGRLLTDNLAEYRVPVNADIGEIEVLFIEEPDYALNPLGARGIGEIGITGVAAAIANAVYHATGKRIRELPITPEKLL